MRMALMMAISWSSSLQSCNGTTSNGRTERDNHAGFLQCPHYLSVALSAVCKRCIIWSYIKEQLQGQGYATCWR